MGKRRNIRITAEQTRRTAQHTAQANRLARQQLSADREAREHEHRFRYSTDSTYRAFCDAEEKYQAAMLAYRQQAAQERRRARMASASAAFVVPAIYVAMVVLMSWVWSVQLVRALLTHEPATYWQREAMRTSARAALDRAHRRPLPPEPQLAILPS